MASSPDPAAAWWALTSVRGLGPKRIQKIATELDRRMQGAETLVGQSPEEVASYGLSVTQAEEAVERLGALDAVPSTESSVVLCPDDDRYPRTRLLAGSPPLPAVLFCDGDLSLLARPAVAIVGSRRVPPELLELASRVARLATSEDRVVVSGLAQGVDEAAHAGALEAGGSTIAVLAEGLDRSARARQALAQHSDGLLLLSEFPPGTDWAPGRAMQRNATVAALANLVVVIAADTKGGTWEMGQLCLKSNKPLAVLDLDEATAPGNARLIKRGAWAVDPERLELPEPTSTTQSEDRELRFDLDV